LSGVFLVNIQPSELGGKRQIRIAMPNSYRAVTEVNRLIQPRFAGTSNYFGMGSARWAH